MPRVLPSKFRRGVPLARAAPPSAAVMVLAALLPIGGHYAKHLIGPLKPHFMSDPAFQLTNTEFGALLSASDWALAFSPVLAGIAVDVIGAHLAAILFCGLSFFGHVLFIVGVTQHSFPSCLAGRCVYGIGEAAMSISQGGIICHSFGREHLTFSLGLSESARALGNWLGKALPAPLAAVCGTYLASLWFGAALLLASQVIAFVLFFLEHSHRPEEVQRSTSLGELLSRGIKPRDVRQFPAEFWLLTMVHVILNNVHNIFAGISTDYIRVRSAVSVEMAAFLGSLDSVGPIFLCSLVSYVVSQQGGRLQWCLGASASCALGFALLLFLPAVPVAACMLLLSANNIIVPTLLRSAVPMLIHPDMYGLGFGLYAGLTGIGGNLNILVGWLRDVSGTYRSGLYLLLFLCVLAVLLCGMTQRLDRARQGCLNLSQAELQAFDAAATIGYLKAELQRDPEAAEPLLPPPPRARGSLSHFDTLPEAEREGVIRCVSAHF